jgi:hypothetical protein
MEQVFGLVMGPGVTFGVARLSGISSGSSSSMLIQRLWRLLRHDAPDR